MRKARMLVLTVAVAIPLTLAVMPGTAVAKSVGTKVCASGVVVKANKPCPGPRFR